MALSAGSQSNDDTRRLCAWRDCSTSKVAITSSGINSIAFFCFKEETALLSSLVDPDRPVGFKICLLLLASSDLLNCVKKLNNHAGREEASKVLLDAFA
jgi:hypothetical protein